MGLGKTLTLLSTIIRTAEHATEFLRQGYNALHDSKSQLRPARATLVIVPSEGGFKYFELLKSLTKLAIINDTWIQEIRK